MGDVVEIAPPPPGRARADFACLSKKCEVNGEASVYELPATATRCPVCGSRRVKRLFNRIQVMKSGFRPLNQIVDRAVADAGEVYHEQRDARLLAQKRQAPALAVPMNQLAGIMGQLGMSVSLDTKTGSRPGLAPAHPLLSDLQGRTPAPGPGSKIDRESKLPT